MRAIRQAHAGQLPEDEGIITAEQSARFREASALFGMGSPLPPGTYFEARINVLHGGFARHQFCFRELPNEETGRKMIALLAFSESAAASVLFDKTTALNLFWMERVARDCFRRARVSRPARTVRWQAGGAIPVWRGSFPWTDQGPTVAIAIGLERAFAAKKAGARVLCVRSSETLKRLALAPETRNVILFGPSASASSLRLAAAHFRACGKTVRIET